MRWAFPELLRSFGAKGHKNTLLLDEQIDTYPAICMDEGNWDPHSAYYLLVFF